MQKQFIGRRILSTNGARATGHSQEKWTGLFHMLYKLTHNGSCIKCKTVKLFEENLGESLWDPGLGEVLLFYLFIYCIKCMNLFFYNLFFNWRKIVLQYCVGFCHTTIQFSHNFWYMYIYQKLYIYISLPPESPSPHPPSLKSSQSARLAFLSYIATSHQLSILHMVVYICQCYFLH